jgi:hypothetical protein
VLVQIQSEAEGCSIMGGMAGKAGKRHRWAIRTERVSESLFPALAVRLPASLIVGPITFVLGGVEKTKDSS